MLVPVPASAQSTDVALTLLRQSPWNSTYGDPELVISVAASDTGTTSFGHLSIELTIGQHYESRVQYESSLAEGPSSGVFQTVSSVAGKLDPFDPRTMTI